MIGQAQRNNPTSSTEVVGSILDQSSCSDGEGAEQTQSDYVALCTLDGMEHVLVEHLSLSLVSFLLSTSPLSPISCTSFVHFYSTFHFNKDRNCF